MIPHRGLLKPLRLGLEPREVCLRVLEPAGEIGAASECLAPLLLAQRRCRLRLLDFALCCFRCTGSRCLRAMPPAPLPKQALQTRH